MKKIAIIFFTFIIYCSITSINQTNAQTNLEPLTTSEVNKLIDEKMKEEKPLTNDELTKALLDLKNEKIANLEGNLSKIIDTAALFVGGVALFFAIILAIIGWLINNSIGKKLAEITNIQESINSTKSYIDSRKIEIDEINENVKKFARKLEESKESLDNSSTILVQKSSQIDELIDYLSTVENLADSSILINKFLISHKEALIMVHETEEVIKNPENHFEQLSLEYRDEMELTNEFEDYEGFIRYFEYLKNSLQENENDFWEKVMDTEQVRDEHEYGIDAEDRTITKYEDLKDKFDDWKAYLEEIEKIKEFFV